MNTKEQIKNNYNVQQVSDFRCNFSKIFENLNNRI